MTDVAAGLVAAIVAGELAVGFVHGLVWLVTAASMGLAGAM